MSEEDILRKLVDKLHDEAIDNIELPQIAVMGDTSSGKSSLLSSLSGIQFPSSDELTTRCPARLHMSRSRDTSLEFFASVHIKWHEDSDYQQHFQKLEYRGEADVMKNLPSGIATAQKFIVEKSGREVCFDIVEIQYTSPWSLDLTLIDLPGYVRSIGVGESASIVSQITALNNVYLNNARCIILAVVPANVDFHNSQILADALKVDPTTERIIPVITKPDLIDRGGENSVLDLLSGRKTNSYKLGFHIVKSRGQQALNEGVTIDGGLQEEDEFFRTNAPWKNFRDKAKIGTVNLRRSLAKLQVDMMKREVPNIVREVEGNLTIFREQLYALGKDLSADADRRNIFEEIKRKLKESLEENITGNPKNEHWKSSDPLRQGYQFSAIVQSSMAAFGEQVLKSRLACIDEISVGSPIQAILNNVSYFGKVLEFLDNKEVLVTIVNISSPDFVLGEVVAYNGCDYRLTKITSSSSSTNPEGILLRSAALTVNSLEKWRLQHKSPRQYVLPSINVTKDNSSWLLELVRRNRGRDLPLFPSAELFNKIVRDIITENIEPLTTGLLNKLLSVLNEMIEWVVNSTISDSLPDLRFAVEIYIYRYIFLRLLFKALDSSRIGNHRESSDGGNQQICVPQAGRGAPPIHK